MEEQQCNVDVLHLQRRQFAHDLAAKIESIGINDDQRKLIMLDLARCFEDHCLASRLWELLRYEFGESTTIAPDCG